MQRKTMYIAVTVMVILVSMGTLAYGFRYHTRAAAEAAIAHIRPDSQTPFPAIVTKELSPQQQAILAIAKAEYAKKPVSYDANVLVYTDGNKEAWCADFATWVFNQAGIPVTNPHSGNWRIPGVLTLQEYYQSQNRYQPVGAYKPQLGDIAFFIGDQTRDAFNRQHVAIVLEMRDGRMTTLGGNEGGHLRLHTQDLRQGEEGLVGFGLLP